MIIYNFFNIRDRLFTIAPILYICIIVCIFYRKKILKFCYGKGVGR